MSSSTAAPVTSTPGTTSRPSKPGTASPSANSTRASRTPQGSSKRRGQPDEVALRVLTPRRVRQDGLVALSPPGRARRQDGLHSFGLHRIEQPFAGPVRHNTGFPRMGFPCVGSWVTYGLGSESRDLPGFVVMSDPKGRGLPKGHTPPTGAPGFLPGVYQGTHLRPTGDPIDMEPACRQFRHCTAEPTRFAHVAQRELCSRQRTGGTYREFRTCLGCTPSGGHRYQFRNLNTFRNCTASAKRNAITLRGNASGHVGLSNAAYDSCKFGRDGEPAFVGWSQRHRGDHSQFAGETINRLPRC